MVLVLAASFFACLLPQIASTAPGDLDPAFGTGGKVTTDFRGSYDSAFAAALQPDGKIVVAGESYRHDGSTTDFALARYNTDGSLDGSFGTAGKVTTPFGESSRATGVVIQPDGKILVCGNGLISLTTAADFVLARYNKDGTLDASFGAGGSVTTDFFGHYDNVNCIATQADGKIILAGLTEQADQVMELHIHFGIARYTPDGTLDATFGSQGKIVGDLSGLFLSIAGAVAVDLDGKILVGVGTVDAANMSHSVITRYNPDGMLDTSFGVGGSIDFNVGFGGGINSLAVQPDGKIVALSEGSTGTHGFIPFQIAVERLKPDGTFDKSFGDGGHVLADFGLLNVYPSGMALAPDGKIVAVGTINVTDNDSDFVVVRYLPDGTLDSGFGSGGKVRTDFNGGIDVASAVVLRPDGRTVVIGYSRNAVTGNDFALASYQGPQFDTCLQDDTTGDWLTFNSQTGEYLFTACGGQSLTLSGTAKIKVKKAGCVLRLSDTGSGRAVSAFINLCAKTGSASVDVTGSGKSFTITDSSTSDDTCSCAHP